MFLMFFVHLAFCYWVILQKKEKKSGLASSNQSIDWSLTSDVGPMIVIIILGFYVTRPYFLGENC